MPSYLHGLLTDVDCTQSIRNWVLRNSTYSRTAWNRRLRSLTLGFGHHSYAHDRLTSFMTKHGFSVTRHYLGLQTAWRAEFTNGRGGRVIGLQSEMDALPNIGHACGHNLIATVGVATALGLQAALKKHDISGKIVLLGTPGEASISPIRSYQS